MNELDRFVELFNRREYWESHELLEAYWRENHSRFYKGLILYASAFVHAQRGNAHGVVAQLRKAERDLSSYRPSESGVDVEALLAHAAECFKVVEAHADVPAEELAALIPHIQLRRAAG